MRATHDPAVNLKLRALRVLHGMTQKDMGALIGLTDVAYSRKESGKRPFSTRDIEVISQKFSLGSEQVIDIFFSRQLATNDNQRKEDKPCKLQQPEITADTLPSTGNTE